MSSNLPSSASDTVVCDSKYPCFRVEESKLDATDLRHPTGFVNIGFGCIEGETSVRHMSLLFAQCFPSVGEVW